jgi:hypothetical protein
MDTTVTSQRVKRPEPEAYHSPPKNLYTLTSPTSGYRSVGIGRSWTKATKFVVCLFIEGVSVNEIHRGLLFTLRMFSAERNFLYGATNVNIAEWLWMMNHRNTEADQGPRTDENCHWRREIEESKLVKGFVKKYGCAILYILWKERLPSRNV